MNHPYDINCACAECRRIYAAVLRDAEELGPAGMAEDIKAVVRQLQRQDSEGQCQQA